MARAMFACLLAFAVGDVAASEPAQAEQCEVFFRTASGALEHRYLASLHVQSMPADATFSLPADAPANVEVVRCTRDALAPIANDFKVLATGIVVAVVLPDGRVGVLETIEGRAQFRTLADATMTDAEQVDVQKALNVGQGVLNALAPAAPGDGSEG